MTVHGSIPEEDWDREGGCFLYGENKKKQFHPSGNDRISESSVKASIQKILITLLQEHTSFCLSGKIIPEKLHQSSSIVLTLLKSVDYTN